MTPIAKHAFIAIAITSLAALVGCATDVSPENEATIGSVENPNPNPNPGGNSSGNTVAEQPATTGCTTTTTCDKDYCCTRESCPYSTLERCVPAPKVKQ